MCQVQFLVFFWRLLRVQLITFNLKKIGHQSYQKLQIFNPTKPENLPAWDHGVYRVSHCAGVQSINNVYAIVNKVENVCVYQYIFYLIDNGVYVVYALYSSVDKKYARLFNILSKTVYLLWISLWVLFERLQSIQGWKFNNRTFVKKYYPNFIFFLEVLLKICSNPKFQNFRAYYWF